MENKEKLIEEIFLGEKTIAIIVFKNKHYYATAYRRAYIKLIDIYSSLYSSYTDLTENHFFMDCEENDIELFTYDEMKEFFTFNISINKLRELYSLIDNYYMLDEGDISNVLYKLSWRLPEFYINFNKKIFRYTDQDRWYSDDMPDDWFDSCGLDFVLGIPDSAQYWVVDNMNFWKLRF